MEDKELTEILKGNYCKTHKVALNEDDGLCEKCVTSEQPWMPENTKNVRDFQPGSPVYKVNWTVTAWALLLSFAIWALAAMWLFGGDGTPPPQ